MVPVYDITESKQSPKRALEVLKISAPVLDEEHLRNTSS